MKKLSLLLITLCSILGVSAQNASTYSFSHSSGTYTQVNDATATLLPLVKADSYISPAQTIGFNFVYEGVTYTDFKMSSNGFISLNPTGGLLLTTNDFSTANASTRPIIAPLWDDLDGRTTGDLSVAAFEVTGTAPGRVLTVEWRNWEWNYNSATPVLSFQVKLYETSGVIEFVYRQESTAITSGSASIGIGSATGSGANSYLNITDVVSPAVSSTGSVTNISTKPANNQVFTFTPPSNELMDYVNLQFPGTATISYGNNATIYTQGYEAGVTEAAGPGAGVQAWIGYNSTNTNPNTWTNWVPATFNVNVGNNDEFQAGIGSNLVPGTYYYASRWRLGNGLYSYGGFNAGAGDGFWDGTDDISGVLTVDPPPPPANDDCGNAFVLTPSPTLTCVTQTSGTTLSATQSAEVAASCGATGTNDDVWYSFVASGSVHIVTLSNVSGSTDMAMAAYSGSCGALTQIICSDPNTMTVGGLAAGQTYYVRVWTFTSTVTTSASFDICITTPPPPPVNDDCGNAVSLTPGTTITCVTQTSGTTLSATQSSEAAASCGAAGINDDVWYSFVASSTAHTVTLSNVSGSTDMAMAVYSGSCGALTQIICSDPNTMTVGGLVAGQTYYVRVWTFTSTVTTSASFDICITTPPPPPANDNICGAISLTVSGETCTTALTGQSTQSATQSLAGCTGTADEDIWYSFVAASTTHYVTISNSGSGSTDRVHQVFSSSDNTCSGTLTSLTCSDPETSTTNSLVIGNTYFVRVYSYSSTTTTYATFDICVTSPAPPPANDAAPGAIALTVGGGCTAAPYTNAGATQASDEKFASCYQSAATGTGITIATHTVWFKFTATDPNVKITTDITGGTLSDTHLALFSATNVADYSTFNIISCDDDNGSTGTLRSVLYATGLTTGQEYLVSVDGYNGATGTFCIAVDNLTSGMLSTTNTCSTTGYQTPSGTQASYAGQVPLVDAVGNLVAIVRNPAGGAVSSFTAAQNINAGAVRQSPVTGTYYLNRNFRIANSTATNVDVQFFFLASELTALNTADGTTLASLAASRQVETVSGCQNNFAAANGPVTLLPQTSNGTSADGLVNWIQVTTPGFSNFYLNTVGQVLPISIEYLRGTKQNNRNVLDWKVTCYNSPTVTLSLERSADGRNFTGISTTTETAVRCLQPFSYNDLAPLAGINYYRLKSVDIDGKTAYSNVVALLNKDKGFEIVSLAPNPVKDEAILSVTSAEKSIMEIVVSDLSGKQISKQRISLIAGNNQVPLNLRNVAAGTYQVSGLTADGQVKSLLFVKQ
jgi:hypothetical protein